MPVKMLIVIVLALALSGCATATKKTSNIELQQLKGRVSGLETDLQAKEQEIMRLEDELEKAREKRVIYKEEKITLEQALIHADSANNLRLKVKLEGLKGDEALDKLLEQHEKEMAEKPKGLQIKGQPAPGRFRKI